MSTGTARWGIIFGGVTALALGASSLALTSTDAAGEDKTAPVAVQTASATATTSPESTTTPMPSASATTTPAQESAAASAWQGQFNSITAQIEQDFPEAFGGSEIVKDDPPVAIVRFNGPAPREALDMLAELPEDVAVAIQGAPKPPAGKPAPEKPGKPSEAPKEKPSLQPSPSDKALTDGQKQAALDAAVQSIRGSVYEHHGIDAQWSANGKEIVLDVLPDDQGRPVPMSLDERVQLQATAAEAASAQIDEPVTVKIKAMN